MTDEFKKIAINMIKKSFPLAGDRQVLEIAEIMWELIPRIYNKSAND